MEPEVCCSGFRILNMIIWNKTFYHQGGSFSDPTLSSTDLALKAHVFLSNHPPFLGFFDSCLFLFHFLILCSSLVFGCLLHYPILFG
jgi:hypothetical protein